MQQLARRAHTRWRSERARAKLGDAFQLKDFHDAVLGSGSLPLTILEEVINDWIQARLTQLQRLPADASAAARADDGSALRRK